MFLTNIDLQQAAVVFVNFKIFLQSLTSLALSGVTRGLSQEEQA